jgi:hypothetical protein
LVYFWRLPGYTNLTDKALFYLFILMKLRDCSPHPEDNYFYWPPLWAGVEEKNGDRFRGEVGTLQYVYANKVFWTKFYLVTHSAGESYVGALCFSHQSLSNKVLSLLRTHIGRTIKEMGDLEI